MKLKILFKNLEFKFSCFSATKQKNGGIDFTPRIALPNIYSLGQLPTALGTNLERAGERENEGERDEERSNKERTRARMKEKK